MKLISCQLNAIPLFPNAFVSTSHFSRRLAVDKRNSIDQCVCVCICDSRWTFFLCGFVVFERTHFPFMFHQLHQFNLMKAKKTDSIIKSINNAESILRKRKCNYVFFAQRFTVFLMGKISSFYLFFACSVFAAPLK